MYKIIRRSILIILAMTILFSTSVMAEGFNLAFYQAMEGQEISIVDINGNIIESVTIDAMGRANFKNNITEGSSLEMNLSSPVDLESQTYGRIEGVSFIFLIGILILACGITFLIASIYFKHKIEKKYEFLMEYEYNAYLDDQPPTA